MNRADSDEFEDFKRASAGATPSGLHERVMNALARRETARAKAARRFVGFSVSLAACVALASLGLALWQNAKLVDGLAHSPDVWIDGEVREP